MRLYFCRLRGDHSTYLGRLLVTRDGYVPTTNLDEVTFSSDREGMEAVACKYPELEVCCLDAEPVTIQVTGNSHVLHIPGKDCVEVELALRKFWAALKDLQVLKPTVFCQPDESNTASVYYSISYDSREDCIRINLRHPDGQLVDTRKQVGKMNLFN